LGQLGCAGKQRVPIERGRFERAYEPILIRAARGAIDVNNHPTSGQAYWFDSDGLLRANFAEGATVINSKFAPWDQKQVPRRIELFIATTPTVVVNVDSIEAL
jgi:hypothetical protein